MHYLFGLVLFAFSAVPTFAATLYIDPNETKLYRGDTVTLSVRLDVDEAAGECINALDGVITYDENITPIDISLGKSIFPIWVETPTINNAAHTITLAGGIPNGYCGRVQGDPNLTNTVVELIFRAPGLPADVNTVDVLATVNFSAKTAAYINDGRGTKASLRTFGTALTLQNTIGSEIKDPWRETVAADTTAPEEFSISLERDDHTFSGDYYIVFNTTDKQTGLSHYEVIEETTADSKLFRFGAATSPWIEARSPYVLKDQSLHSVVRVRAIDKAGNEYLATLVPDDSLKTTSLSLPLTVLLIGSAILCLGIIFVAWFWYRSYRCRILSTPTSHE
jgi:hypothetical protein